MHTLALFAFLPLIPHTKHLHLLLSPVTVFLSRGGFSRIPPLSGDEDFGLVAGKDVTRLNALQAYSCVECGRCTEHCPASNTGKALNPKLIALGMRDYLNQYGVTSETPIVGATISQEAIFQCTTCGACEYQCPVGIEHLPLIIGLRRAEVNTADGKTSTARSYSSVWNETETRWASRKANVTSSSPSRTACIRWLAGILSLAGLHGRL